MLGHEPRERALEIGDVDATTKAGHLQYGLRDGVGVAATDARHELAQRGLLHGVEPSRGTEVDQRETTVAQQHHVPRVRVGVEHTVLEHLLEESLEEQIGDLRALGRSRVAPGDVTHARAVEPLHHEHPRRAQVFVDLGNGDPRPVGKAGRDRPRVAGFDAEVELFAQARAELVDQVHHVILGAPRRARLDHAPELLEHRQVDGDRAPRYRGG